MSFSSRLLVVWVILLDRTVETGVRNTSSCNLP